MTGREDERDGERFADLVDDVVPLPDPPRTRTPEGRRPEPPRQGATREAPPRFIRDTGAGSGRAADAARRLVGELQRGDHRPERELDLHGMRRDAARRALHQGLAAAQAARERCLLVIHGLGRRSPDEPVLKQALPDWIEQSPVAASVIAYAPAPRNQGGAGATLILLRRARGHRD